MHAWINGLGDTKKKGLVPLSSASTTSSPFLHFTSPNPITFIRLCSIAINGYTTLLKFSFAFHYSSHYLSKNHQKLSMIQLSYLSIFLGEKPACRFGNPVSSMGKPVQSDRRGAAIRLFEFFGDLEADEKLGEPWKNVLS